MQAENYQLEHQLIVVFRPLIRLLVNLVCGVFAVLEYVYIFEECPRAITVFLHIMMMCFLLRSHDVAAFMHKMACRLLYSSPSVLQTFLRRYATQKWPLLNSGILNLSIPGFPRSSASLLPVDASSNNTYIGGGCPRIAWATIKSYAVSQLSALHDWNFLSYVAYVEKVDDKAYPNVQFVHANIPPLVISQLLKLSVARSIAASAQRWV